MAWVAPTGDARHVPSVELCAGDLGPRFVRHSVFTCPISKEAGTPDNPPMLLLCGHVLGLASITKLARGSRSARFKCPYCPVESSMDDAKALDL